MVSSKIKGHRIGDGQVQTKHLHKDFRLEEEKMTLNHPTHSNEADLTVDQRNTLTQMGNADHLHFHTGGGGGPQGIYTNEERDIQLLKLSMLINSTKYGLDKSVKDEFDNDSSVDYGMRPALPPQLKNITDGPELGTLQPNKRYSYGVTYKSKYGETNIINAESITTGMGTANSVEMTLRNVPDLNEGAVIYRADGDTERMLVENERPEEWSNPGNLKVSVEGSDKTSGYGSLKVDLKGSHLNGAIQLGRRDLAAGIGKRVIPGTSPMKTVLPGGEPIAYVIGINNKGTTNRLDLIWDKSPSNVPADYEIFYTTDGFISPSTSVTWRKFDAISKMKALKGESMSASTDGNISEEGVVTGNTRPTNVFMFRAVANITGVKIIIRNAPQFCNLVDLFLWSERNSGHDILRKDFGTPLDMSPYGTMKVDMKSNHSHRKAQMALWKANEAVTGSITEWSYSMSSYIDMSGKTIRARIDESGAINRSGYDRVRIGIQFPINEYVKIENIFLHLDAVNTGVTAVDSSYPTTNKPLPVTFDGKNYYEGTPTATTQYSDWIPFDFPNTNFYSFVITFTVVSGRIAYTSSNSYAYAWHVDSNIGRGLEGEDWLGNIATTDITVQDNYQYLTAYLHVGKSDAHNWEMDYFPDEGLDRWHRHHLPIPAGINAENVQSLVMKFDNLLVDQDLYIDNIVMSKSKDVLNQITGSTVEWSAGGKVPTYAAVNTSSYAYSDLAPTVTVPKNFLIAVPTPEKVNKLIMLFGRQGRAGKNFALEYTEDPTATAEDPYGSPLWQPVTQVRVGESGIPSNFTGTVLNNVIYDNNVWESHLSFNFDSVTALKFRVVFFSTDGGERVEITNLKLMTAEELGEFKKIYETPAFVTEGQVVIDDGKAPADIAPPEFNTTGSFNVFYDADLRLMRLIDKTKIGSVVFRELTLDMYKHIILTAQTIGSVRFYTDNGDGGEDFDPVELDKLHTYGNQSKELTLKAELLSPDAALSAIAFLYSL